MLYFQYFLSNMSPIIPV